MRLRVQRSELVRDAGPLAAGLFAKLVLAPAITLLFASSIGLRGERLAVTIAQCGMAPMVTAGMIAAEHGLNPSLASSLVAAGVFLSLVTVPLWTWALAAAGL
jgi:predicted permease